MNGRGFSTSYTGGAGYLWEREVKVNGLNWAFRKLAEIGNIGSRNFTLIPELAMLTLSVHYEP